MTGRDLAFVGVWALRQRVIHAGRDAGMDGTGHEAVALQLSQRQCEHPLGDAGDGTVQFPEAQGAVAELPDDQNAPLVPDRGEDLRHLSARQLPGPRRSWMPCSGNWPGWGDGRRLSRRHPRPREPDGRAVRGEERAGADRRPGVRSEPDRADHPRRADRGRGRHGPVRTACAARRGRGPARSAGDAPPGRRRAAADHRHLLKRSRRPSWPMSAWPWPVCGTGRSPCMPNSHRPGSTALVDSGQGPPAVDR